MPVRVPRPIAGEALVVHRSFRWGDVATTAVVDNRQYRAPPPDPAGAGALPRPLGGGPQVAEALDVTRGAISLRQRAAGWPLYRHAWDALGVELGEHLNHQGGGA